MGGGDREGSEGVDRGILTQGRGRRVDLQKKERKRREMGKEDRKMAR